MAIKNIKNITIILLCMLSMYLTGQLWFEGISSRNFFSFLDSVVYQPTEEDRSGIVTPYRIITNFGNKTFNVIYNNIMKSVPKTDSDQILDAVLKDGEFVESKEIDWTELLKSRSYIYQYKKPISSEVFARGFGQKGSVLTSRVKYINSIIIIPASLSDEKVRVLFVDSENNLYHEYTMNNRQAFSSFVRNMQTVRNDAVQYTSSAQMGLVMLKENVYIPSWTDSSYEYNPVSVTNPYIKTERLRDVIGEHVDIFFTNPAAKRSDMVNGVYTYGDADIVVKYHTNDVLEYFDYSTVTERIKPVLTRDYNLAVRFIEKDIYVTNEYYLADYYSDNNETTVFYFDYAVNNMPVLFPKAYAKEKGMEHFIEVTVENGKVYKYKKLVYNLQIDTNLQENATEDFFTSLNSLFVSEEHINESNLSGVELAYRMDSNKRLLLYWFLDFEGQWSIKSVQQK